MAYKSSNESLFSDRTYTDFCIQWVTSSLDLIGTQKKKTKQRHTLPFGWFLWSSNRAFCRCSERISNYHIMTKLPYFFICPDKLVCVHFLRNIERINENLFVFRVVFFSFQKIEWMNDMWLFRKKYTKIPRKKNTIIFF